ncbi:hypothetical protein BKA81DRAFT_346601 [Phyllosticta paracitricarpa]
MAHRFCCRDRTNAKGRCFISRRKGGQAWNYRIIQPKPDAHEHSQRLLQLTTS